MDINDDDREISLEMRLAAIEFVLGVVLGDLFKRNPNLPMARGSLPGDAGELTMDFVERMAKEHPDVPSDRVQEVAGHSFEELDLAIKRLIQRGREMNEDDDTGSDQNGPA